MVDDVEFDTFVIGAGKPVNVGGVMNKLVLELATNVGRVELDDCWLMIVLL